MRASAGVWGPSLMHVQGVLIVSIFKRVSCFVLIALVLFASVLPIQARAAVGPMVDLLNLFTAMWNAWGMTVEFNSGSDTTYGPVTEWQQTQLELFLQHIGSTFNEWYQGIEYRILHSGDLWVNPTTVLKASEFANWLVEENDWVDGGDYGIINFSGWFLSDGAPFVFTTNKIDGTKLYPGQSYSLTNGTTFTSIVSNDSKLYLHTVIDGGQLFDQTIDLSNHGYSSIDWWGVSRDLVNNDHLGIYVSGDNRSGSNYKKSVLGSSYRVSTVFGTKSNVIASVVTGVIGVPDTDTLDPSLGMVVDVGAGAGSDLAGVLDTVVQGVQAGDLAVTMTPATAADVKDDVVPDYGTGADYAVNGLLDLFPFCIPADIYSFINLLVAAPETPSFDIPMQFGDIASYTWHFDLHDFDGIAANMRKFELLGFIIALMFVTRDIIRG